MFYNHDILSRRRTGLGIVWLAATLGDRSVVRRITRKDILSVDIDRACEYVRSPTEPLALRLSSQLLYGVVKLYGSKTELLYQDVANVHSDVRRRMLSMPTGEVETRNIDMRKAVSSLEAITVPLDVAFFSLEFDEFTTRLVGRWSIEPPERRRQAEEEVEDAFRTPTPASFVAEDERITLAAGRRAFEEEEELGLARGLAEGEELGFEFGAGFDEEDVEGLDLGLEGVEPSAARPERFVPGGPEGMQRRDVGDDTTVSMGPMVEWPELEERLAEEAARMQVGPVIEGVPTVTPARRPRDDEEAEVEAFLRVTARRPRPTPLPSEDRRTELTETQLRNARLDYEERMTRERAVREAASQKRAADATVRRNMFEPPEDLSLHPMLSEMWQVTVGEHLTSRRARFAQMRTEAALSPIDEVPPLPPPPTPMDLDEPAEVGVARAAAVEPELPASLRGARESLPWNVFMEHRRRSSMMPSVSYDRPPTLDERETTPLRLRELSVETPTGLRRIAPHESPLLPPASPSTIAPFEEFYHPPPSLPGTPSAERFRLGLPTAAAPPAADRSPTPPSQIFQEDMEEETRNFLEYARSIRDQLEDPDFLFFSDLAPVPSSTPAVAAQAFYHTLALATRGRMRVKQDEAYQEIRISLVAAKSGSISGH